MELELLGERGCGQSAGVGDLVLALSRTLCFRSPSVKWGQLGFPASMTAYLGKRLR